jgi:hypothetical protein
LDFRRSFRAVVGSLFSLNLWHRLQVLVLPNACSLLLRRLLLGPIALAISTILFNAPDQPASRAEQS